MFCDQIEELANGRWLASVQEKTETLLAYLTEDLPLHAMDEEKDLFRLLKLRSHPEDGFQAVLAQLEFEHGVDKVLAHHVVIDLGEMTPARALSSPTRIFEDLRTFADRQRRHLAWENSVVLPLAHKRLTPSDLAEMGHNMAVRRGITKPG